MIFKEREVDIILVNKEKNSFLIEAVNFQTENEDYK
jgi:hypothetical protein